MVKKVYKLDNSYPSKLFLINKYKFNGAPEENNLEPFECDRLLSELENWTDILNGSPEVIHRLEALSKADDQDADPGKGPEPAPATLPDLQDPSP